MLTKDLPKRLGVSRQTVYNYRRTLGILEETKKEVNRNQLKLIESVHENTFDGGKLDKEQKKEKIVIKAHQRADGRGFIEISDNEDIKLKNLKGQYNLNLEVINYLSEQAKMRIVSGAPLAKIEMDMLEKYQKANINIMQQLERSSGTQEKDIATQIADRLAGY